MPKFVYTEAEALQITHDLWSWLAETGREWKDEWPGWKGRKRWAGDTNCALCTFSEKTADAATLNSRGGRCRICPWWRVYRNCGNVRSPYSQWNEAEADATRKRNAGIIRDRITGLIASAV